MASRRSRTFRANEDVSRSLSSHLLSRMAIIYWTASSQLCSMQSEPVESSDTQPSHARWLCCIVLHADLEGRNSRNQRRFQYILSVMDSATRYLWLLPIRHKTAEAVAATTLFDEVISRVSVPSTILTDLGGEFTGEVVECLYKRLRITDLKTSAYHPQMDAKCECVHFSMHNMVTKHVGDKHDRWPDLLGTTVLAYNATVHTTTGYNPQELFYSFAPACPLDALVTAPPCNLRVMPTSTLCRP